MKFRRLSMDLTQMDLYHQLLTRSWMTLVLFVTVIYLCTNLLFSLLYLAGGDCIDGARAGSLADYFAFSVQTMSTIGYGVMAPRTYYAHMLVAVEALTGMLGFAMATGLMFSKFARPSSRIVISGRAVVRPFHGRPTLMFRAANTRSNDIIEARMRAFLLMDEVAPEGDTMRRWVPLTMDRDESPVFAYTWTGLHVIDETSPLHGMSLERMTQIRVRIMVIVSGVDGTHAQTVYARRVYEVEDIHWNARFVDILRFEGDLVGVEFNKLDDVEPLG